MEIDVAFRQSLLKLKMYFQNNRKHQINFYFRNVFLVTYRDHFLADVTSQYDFLYNKGLIQRRRQRVNVWAGYGATYVRLAQKKRSVTFSCVPSCFCFMIEIGREECSKLSQLIIQVLNQAFRSFLQIFGLLRIGLYQNCMK